jgi:hypothetical protein
MKIALLILMSLPAYAANIAECTRDSDLLTVAEVQAYFRCNFDVECEQEVIRKSGIPPECAELYKVL